MKLKKIAATILGIAATLGFAGVASASPLLQITQGAANGATPPWPNAGGAPLIANQEAIGDPGGSNHANGPTVGASAGPGMPTALGGWPNSANFFPDTYGYNVPPGCIAGVNCTPGISGYDGSYLNLTQASNVTFQFMGKGNSVDQNQFWIYTSGAWTMLWDTKSTTNGTCGVNGTTPNCPNAGSEVTFHFDAGLIPFYFENVTHSATAKNDGTNNPKDVAPGFFLGVDPYLANAPFDTTGKAVYAGFTDLPPPGDHDYQDLSVRISVPEPGTTLLLGAGLMGLAYGRRRQS